jgi:hypothetical protein
MLDAPEQSGALWSASGKPNGPGTAVQHRRVATSGRRTVLHLSKTGPWTDLFTSMLTALRSRPPPRHRTTAPQHDDRPVNPTPTLANCHILGQNPPASGSIRAGHPQFVIMNDPG